MHFLAEHEGADSERHDQAILRAAMRRIATRISAGRLGLEKGRERFNAALKGHLEIRWMGHFDEMLSGKHPFAKVLRAGFLEVEDPTTISPIPPAQVKDFIEELRTFGH